METGYCKLNTNTLNAMQPKMINELDTCDKWERK